MAPYSFHNRDISWLYFNYRVLQEAGDESIPLFERIKFLAIYSNNLEEFYRVRVSYYRGLLRDLPPTDEKIKAVDPAGVIQQINSLVSEHQEEFSRMFFDVIIPALKDEGIVLVSKSDILSLEQKEFIYKTYMHEVLTSIQPVLLVKKKVKPFLKTGHVYLALRLFTKIGTEKRFKKGSRPLYGLVKLPTDHGVSRFIGTAQTQWESLRYSARRSYYDAH
ncbi:MAG: hypothetical protein HC896_08070 [Bacteroidales bacterium]|nr:hypothetical protein [Bacteroidales bacterium]